MKEDDIIWDDKVDEGTVYFIPKRIFEDYAKLNSDIKIEEKQVTINGIPSKAYVIKNLVCINDEKI